MNHIWNNPTNVTDAYAKFGTESAEDTNTDAFVVVTCCGQRSSQGIRGFSHKPYDCCQGVANKSSEDIHAAHEGFFLSLALGLPWLLECRISSTKLAMVLLGLSVLVRSRYSALSRRRWQTNVLLKSLSQTSHDVYIG